LPQEKGKEGYGKEGAKGDSFIWFARSMKETYIRYYFVYVIITENHN